MEIETECPGQSCHDDKNAMSLSEFAVTVRDTDPYNDLAFQMAIESGTKLLPLSDNDMCHFLGVSFPTLMRWKTGKTAPHPAMRVIVFHFLADYAESYERDVLSQNV